MIKKYLWMHGKNLHNKNIIVSKLRKIKLLSFSENLVRKEQKKHHLDFTRTIILMEKLKKCF
jgi:hypothetical protein